MVGKEKFDKKKKTTSRISVFVSDNKASETIDVNELEMKITKLNSMIKNVERRMDAHQRRLSNIYESNESRETKEHILNVQGKISTGQ